MLAEVSVIVDFTHLQDKLELLNLSKITDPKKNPITNLVAVGAKVKSFLSLYGVVTETGITLPLKKREAFRAKSAT